MGDTQANVEWTYGSDDDTGTPETFDVDAIAAKVDRSTPSEQQPSFLMMSQSQAL